MAANNKSQKDTAFELFMRDMSQKDIAKTLGTTEASVSRWKKEGNWEELKEATAITPKMIVREVQSMLFNVTQSINNSPEGEVSGKKVLPTKEDVDLMSRLSTIITQLKSGPTLSDTIAVCEEFLAFVTEQMPDLADEVHQLQIQFLSIKARK